MYDTITEDYLVMDETLLLSRHPSAQITIPREIPSGHPITRIGNSAFCSNQELKSVEIPDGVTYVGPNNFLYRSTLSEILIPTSVTTWEDQSRFGSKQRPVCSLTMTEAEYSRLLSKSVYASSGNYLIRDLRVFPVIEQLVTSLHYASPAQPPEGIPLLIADAQDPKVRCSRSPFGVQDCLRFDGVDEQLSEDEAFRLLFRRGMSQPDNPAVEQFDDYRLSRDEELPYQKVTLVLFSPELVELREDGRRVVPLMFSCGYFYWQSAVKVCCRGKPYYIYRRNYLTSDDKLPYHRLDMAVYDKNGLVTNRALSEEVYAKYKLSFLF